MNGAMAEPLVSTINAPKPNKITIMGASQNFFRSWRKPHKSFRNTFSNLPDLIRLFEVQSGVFVIALHHYGAFALFEHGQFQGVTTG